MGLRKPSFRRNRSTKTQSTTGTQPSSKVELSPKRTATKERTHEIFHTNETLIDAENKSDLASQDPVVDSACCTRSRCGWPDQIHETFLFVGKHLYDCLGDPPNAEAKDYVVGVSEIGEEGATFDDATFCCWSGDQIVEHETKSESKEVLM